MTPAELAYRATTSGIEERNELVMSELPQVYYIAARIRERLPQHVEMEELVNAGVIGLLEACRTFDASKDAQFNTFARFRIRGAIVDSLRELDWGSRALRRKGRDINASIAKLELSLGRQPVEEEIAADLGMTLEGLQDALAQLDGLYLVGQRSAPSHDNDAMTDLIESAPSRGGDNPFDLCLEGERKAHLAEAVSRLPEREQLILSLYYREELTMKEVSVIVGLAVSRVSQIHSAAMLTLRASLGHLQNESRNGSQNESNKESRNESNNGNQKLDSQPWNGQQPRRPQ